MFATTQVCADTLVGSQLTRGISGGQKRRVTLGERIVGPCRALFMGAPSLAPPPPIPSQHRHTGPCPHPSCTLPAVACILHTASINASHHPAQCRDVAALRALCLELLIAVRGTSNDVSRLGLRHSYVVFSRIQKETTVVLLSGTR